MKKHGPWIIKRSVLKYKNPWIEVREDKVIRPDGKPGIFGTVTMKSGVSILAMDESGFVYLIKEFQYALRKNSVEVVSGAIDKGETPLAAAKRELQEELGIQADKWTDLGTVNAFTSVVYSPAYLFFARTLRFGKTKLEGTEKIKMVKVRFHKAVQMVMKSKITHTASCALILKANEYLK